MRPRIHAIGREAGCTALYAALGAAATYPLVGRVTTAVPRGGDSWQNIWNLWWVKRAFLDLQSNPYFTSDLHAPYGASLYFHTLNLLQSVLVLPITVTLGLAAAFNALVFASFAFSGYGAYRLAIYVLRTSRRTDAPAMSERTLRLSAFVAGAVFSFSSYRFVHVLGHLDLASTQWLPLFVLFLLKTRDERGWLNPLVCGIFLAAASFTAAYYMAFLLVLTGLLAVHLIVTERGWKAPAQRITGALVTFALISAPMLVPMLVLGRTEGRTTNPGYDIDRFSGDVVAFFVPSPLSTLGQFVGGSTYETLMRPGSNVEIVTFLGYTALVLAGIGLWARLVSSGFWILSLSVFALLALGPVPYVMGRAIPALSVVMPYRLQMLLPYGDIARVPARYAVMAMLSLSLLAALGAAVLLEGRRRVIGALAAVSLTCLIVSENAVVPFPTMTANVPTYFETLANDPDRRAVLEVPIPDDPAAYSVRMLYQTVHEKPIFGGYLSRAVPSLDFAAVPGFAQFKSLSHTVEDIVAYESATLPQVSRVALAHYLAGTVVIEKDLMASEEAARAQTVADALFGRDAQIFDDARTAVYRLGAPGVAPYAVWLDRGWSYLERLATTAPGGQSARWRWMSDRARMVVAAPAAGKVRLRLTAQSFRRNRRIRISSEGEEIGTVTVTLNQQTLQTPAFSVRPGVRVLELDSLDGADSPGVDRRRLSVALFDVSLEREP